MRFFLLKPYDFGASGKNIKTGGKISSDFPFKNMGGSGRWRWRNFSPTLYDPLGYPLGWRGNCGKVPKFVLIYPFSVIIIVQEIDRNQSDKVTFHNLLFIVAYKKINNISKALQLEERLKREEYDRTIMEESASKIITNFMIHVYRKTKASSKKIKLGKSK